MKLTGNCCTNTRMNVQNFIVAPVTKKDKASVGFSIDEISTLLLKKLLWRYNSSHATSYINEPIHKPPVFPEQIMVDDVPQHPPDDFVPLTYEQIADQFGIELSEVSMFETTVNGIPSFFVERSVSYPHIYRFNKCRLHSWTSNPDLTFTAITLTTKVNILEYSIPFYIGDGGWRGSFYRTGISGELSRGGADVIKETQFSYMFDGGMFTCYEKDMPKYKTDPVSACNPPSVTCYVYKGQFGLAARFNQAQQTVYALEAALQQQTAQAIQTQNAVTGLLAVTQTQTDQIENIYNTFGATLWGYVAPFEGAPAFIHYNNGNVVIGKTSQLDTTEYVFDVSGTGFITNIVTSSLETFSDRRLKTNIIPYPTNASVLFLNTYTYNYIDKPGTTEMGLIAQEVEAVAPEIVKEHNGFKTVQYDRIGVLLLPIVREQQERIEQLEKDTLELKQLVAHLLLKLS